MPAVWATIRMFDRDVVIGGYNIPQDTAVLRVGSYSSVDPRNFSEPLKFYPERWLRNHKDRHCANSFANIPFGHGAR